MFPLTFPRALVACLVLVASSAVDAQEGQVHVFFPYGGSELVVDGTAVATEKLPAEIRSLANTSHASLAATVDVMEDHCFVETRFTVINPKLMPRIPAATAWDASEIKRDEAKSAACTRAFTAAVTSLAKLGTLTKSIRESVEDDKAPSYQVPRDLPPKRWTANSSTSGLSDAGRKLIVDTLGEKFTTVFDYRRFTVRVELREFKTLEGRSMCHVEAGLTARTSNGVPPRMPAHSASYAVVNKAGDTSDCTRTAFDETLQHLAADPIVAYANFAYVAEPGVKYPTEKELKAAMASFDREAEQNRKRAEAEERAAAKRNVVSRTSSRNVLSCTNECYNGMCTRTFSDGRKERWQAPRKYNPFTQNWEWDTQTNACGG